MKLFAALSPPVFENDNKTRAAHLLYYILLFTLMVDVGVTLVVAVTTDLDIRYAGVDFGAAAGVIFLIWMLHRGNVRLTGNLVAAFFWLILSCMVYSDSGILNPVFSGYMIVVLIAGLVINMRLAVIYSVLSCAFGLWLVYAAEQGAYLAQIGNVSVIIVWLDYVAIFSLVTFCLMVGLRTLRIIHERVVVSEERYRDLFHSNPLPTWVLDLGTMNFIDANKAVIEQYGYERDAISGMGIGDICVSQDIQAVADLAAQLQTGTIPNGRWNHVWQHIKKDGSIIQVELSFHRLTYMGRNAVMIAVYDLSERIQAETALRSSEERYRIISELISDNVSSYAVDADKTLTQEWVMGGVATLANYTQENMQSAYDGFHPDDRERAVKDVKAVIAGATISGEYRVIDEHGEQLWIEIRRFPIMDTEQKQVIRFISVARDISRRKDDEAIKSEAERLRLELEKQRELLLLKENFIAMMSHEFRTPLALILSAKEALHHYYDRLTAERREEKLQQIESQVRHVISLLDDILTMGKASAGKLAFYPTTLDLIEFCRQLIDEIQITDKHAHEFIFEAEEVFTDAYVDPQLLQHILVNLLSNAIKYSPDGSSIRITLSKDSECAVFVIRDEGMGIPLADQPQIFEAFHRGKNAQFMKGTGLGLTIVKQSVEVHGGRVEVQSIEGAGTTFTVRLPTRPKTEQG